MTVNYVRKEVFDKLLTRYEEEQTNWLESTRGGSELDICMAELICEIEEFKEESRKTEISMNLDYDE